MSAGKPSYMLTQLAPDPMFHIVECHFELDEDDIPESVSRGLCPLIDSAEAGYRGTLGYVEGPGEMMMTIILVLDTVRSLICVDCARQLKKELT